jgi:ABC-2 type transport system permease protein
MSKNQNKSINPFGMLLVDELKGFYKSKVMAVLLIGMPLVSALMLFIQPETEGLPLLSLVAVLVASLGGTLGSVILATGIVNEKTHHVYDLFVIRNENIRPHMILAKFFAVYLSLISAVILSLIVGILVDSTRDVVSPEIILENLTESLVISMAAMAIACSIGILIGLLINSVPAAAITAIYAGNQLSIIAVLPGIMLENIDPIPFSLTIGLVISITVIVIDIILFNKKQL